MVDETPKPNLPDRDMSKPCKREDCDYTFEKYGRTCQSCSKWMVDFGD